MTRLEVSGAVQPLQSSLGVKGLKLVVWKISSQLRRTDAGKPVTNVITPLVGEECHLCEFSILSLLSHSEQN